MKWIRYRAKRILFCLCVMIVMCCAFFYYYRQINNQVYRSMLDNMQELAKHDLNTIQTNVEKKWEQLEFIHTRMLYYDYSLTNQMQERLHIEQSSSDFDKLYYVTQDGEMYSGDYMVSENAELVRYIQTEEDMFVTRYDTVDTLLAEFQREYLIYGISIQPWEIDGVVFTRVIGQTEIDSIQDELVIKNYQGQGYSSIVDEDGYYIVNVNQGFDFQVRQNFNESYKNGTFRGSGGSVAEIEQKLRDGEMFSTIYRDESGSERIMTFQKNNLLNWYFIMEVSRDVFASQTRRIIGLSLAVALLLAAAVAVSLWLWYIMGKRSLQAKAQLEARNEFLSNMSHEIRTPLNGLIGLNHLMTQHIDDRRKLREYLQKASHTAQYLLALVNDILDMSKLQAGKVELFLSSVNLNMAVDNVVSMQKDNIESRGIRFEVELEIQEPWIRCDEVRVKQVLMNLLSNAAKFTPEGGTITLRVRQEKEEERIKTCFEVSDTGCGMSKEFQEHIFEVFTQEREQNPESQKGTGLGMAISFLLMKTMGGELSVDSTLGKGSTFYASFPAEIAEEPDMTGDAPPLPEKSSAVDGLNVLIAEDNELNAEILVEILDGYGITSSVAVNGREAVEMFAASAPGEYPVILMDVQMPEMNGYEATKAIRNLKREDATAVKILACTANTFQEDIDRIMECGMNEFIGKPIDMEELIRKLSEL